MDKEFEELKTISILEDMNIDSETIQSIMDAYYDRNMYKCKSIEEMHRFLDEVEE